MQHTTRIGKLLPPGVRYRVVGVGGMDGLLPNTETGHFLSVLFSLMVFTAVSLIWLVVVWHTKV